MKGFRFYADYPEDISKRRPVADAGNVIAVSTDREAGRPERGEWLIECIAAIFSHPNSPVATTSVARSYLDKRCKRVSEAVARTIHPQLFERLDRNEARPPDVRITHDACGPM